MTEKPARFKVDIPEGSAGLDDWESSIKIDAVGMLMEAAISVEDYSGEASIYLPLDKLVQLRDWCNEAIEYLRSTP